MDGGATSVTSETGQQGWEDGFFVRGGGGFQRFFDFYQYLGRSSNFSNVLEMRMRKENGAEIVTLWHLREGFAQRLHHHSFLTCHSRYKTAPRMGDKKEIPDLSMWTSATLRPKIRVEIFLSCLRGQTKMPFLSFFSTCSTHPLC